MRSNEEIGAKHPELLAPAGNLEKLKVAVFYGADAVYIGGKNYSLRMGAENFDIPEIKEGVDFARANGVKVYVTINIFARNEDLDGLKEYLLDLSDIGVDAIIVADPGVFFIAKRIIPKMPIHVSTQANVTNVASAKFWKEMGATRVTLARELSFSEIKEIAQSVDIETEAFVHGAMCIAYSGRCLMSKYLADRDANRGDCAHSCRWKYFLVEEKRPGEYHPVYEDERGTYFFNSKDLCLARHVPELISAGVSSFKIEGRMKSLYYVAAVTNVYKQIIDNYCASPEDFAFQDEWFDELKKVSHRGYTTGFFTQKNDCAYPSHQQANQEMVMEETNLAGYKRTYDFVGIVMDCKKKEGTVKIGVRNRISIGDEIEVLSPKKISSFKISSMIDAKNGKSLNAAHANYVIDVPVGENIVKNSILRRRISEKQT